MHFPMTIEEARTHWRWAPLGCRLVFDEIRALPGPDERADIEAMMSRYQADMAAGMSAARRHSPLARHLLAKAR